MEGWAWRRCGFAGKVRQVRQNGTQNQAKMLPDRRLSARTDRIRRWPDLPIPVPERLRLNSFVPKRAPNACQSVPACVEDRTGIERTCPGR